VLGARDNLGAVRPPGADATWRLPWDRSQPAGAGGLRHRRGLGAQNVGFSA